MYAYHLEPFPATELDKRRSRVDKCPCGRSNKDGKFVPFAGFEDRGYCHSCGQCFRVGHHTCPQCRMPHAFNRYIAVDSNTYVNEKAGKCLLCNYHLTPKQYFTEHGQAVGGETTIAALPPQPCPLIQSAKHKTEPVEVSYIPSVLFERSLSPNGANAFIEYLQALFGPEITAQVASRYHIGTSPYQFRQREFPGYVSSKGATVFWQVDQSGRVHTGKIMLYDACTGKRIKEPFNHVSWVHTLLKQPDFHLQQCLFGEHLLATNYSRPIGVVESEKTAIIASVYLPQFLWLACGSLTSLNAQRCQVLTGKDVILFPDLEGFDQWSAKARELSHMARFRVSDLLEKRASAWERSGRLDLADYLVKFPLEQF